MGCKGSRPEGGPPADTRTISNTQQSGLAGNVWAQDEGTSPGHLDNAPAQRPASLENSRVLPCDAGPSRREPSAVSEIDQRSPATCDPTPDLHRARRHPSSRLS